MEDRCVCCGAIIPEGSWACPRCLVCVNAKQENDDENNEISQPCI